MMKERTPGPQQGSNVQSNILQQQHHKRRHRWCVARCRAEPDSFFWGGGRHASASVTLYLSSHRDASLSCSVHATVRHSLVPFCDQRSSFSKTTENQLDGSARHLEEEEAVEAGSGWNGSITMTPWIGCAFGIGIGSCSGWTLIITGDHGSTVLRLCKERLAPTKGLEWHRHAFDHLTVPQPASDCSL